MGEFSQRTGVLGVSSGDFSMMYENDGAPFGKGKIGKMLGDGNDSYRSASMRFQVGEFSAGFNLFTGFRDNYDGENVPETSLWHRLTNKVPRGTDGGFGSNLPYGEVIEEKTAYRMGAAYLGWGNYRIGLDSDRHVRHPIQNILAHHFIAPQPGFRTLSNSINPYFQYQTRNPYTTW